MRRKPDESQPTSLKRCCCVVRGFFPLAFVRLWCGLSFPFRLRRLLCVWPAEGEMLREGQ